MATGKLLGAAIGSVIKDGLIYVVTPAGEVLEVSVPQGGGRRYSWTGKGQPFLTRTAAEAAAQKIKGRS